MHVHATKFLVLRREDPFDDAEGQMKNFKRGVGGRLKFFWRTSDREFFCEPDPEFFVKGLARI
jgi:hypothetical protein